VFDTLRDYKISEGPITKVMGGQGKFTTQQTWRRNAKMKNIRII